MADNLSVAVTADTSDLRAQLALAQADLRAFGAEIRNTANQIRSSANDNSALRSQLEQVAGQYNRAKAEVTTLTAALRDGKAQTAEHASGISLVSNALSGFAATAAETRERVVGTFEKIQGAWLALAGVFAGGALFREAIQDVIQLDQRVTGLQRSLGLDREAALQTDVALRLIGKSSEDYAHVLLRLEQQVRSNEARMNQLGVATRDASGEYLKLPQIFQNALAAIQTYKAGTDQAGVAQELFRRSAQEMFSYMDLTPAIFERAKQVIHDFGIELGDHESMIQYRVNLAAIGIAGEAVGHQLADQLMPALSGLAAWFTGPGAGAVRAFGVWLKGLASAVIDAGALFQQFKVTMATTWDEIVEIMRSAALKGKAIITGAWGELEQLSREHETRMTAIAAAGAEERVQITLREAKALEAIWGKGGEGGESITLPDVNVSGGGRRYTPAEKGGRAGGGRGKGDDGYAAFAEGERLKIQEAKGDWNQIDQIYQEWADKAKALYGEDSVQFRRVMLEKTAAQQRAAQQMFEQSEQGYSAQRQIDDAYLAAFKSNMDAMAAQHKLTKEQALGFDIEYTAQLHDQERQRLEDLIQSDNLTVADKTRVYMQLLELDARYTAQVQADQQKIVEAQQQAADKFAQPFIQAFDQIGSSFESTITGILEKTTSWQQGMQKIFNSVLQAFTKMIGDMLSQWAASGLASLLGVEAGEGAGVGSVLGKAVAGLFGGGGGGAEGGDWSSDVADAGAGAAESFGIGSIFKGLFSGIGALFGFAKGGVVPSAAGGWVVPSFQNGGILSMLHQNEMVLPANISTGLQNMIASGGGAAGNQVVANFSVAAMDSQDVARFFRSNGATLVAALNQAMRNGAMLRSA